MLEPFYANENPDFLCRFIHRIALYSVLLLYTSVSFLFVPSVRCEVMLTLLLSFYIMEALQYPGIDSSEGIPCIQDIQD